MKRIIAMIVAACAIVLVAPVRNIPAADTQALLTGTKAFGDWHDDAPGVRRKITVADLPPPFATESAGNGPHIVPRPPGAEPKVPPGFTVTEFASGLDHPRAVRVAPNGDLFISESNPGRIRLLRASDGAGAVQREEVFASGLTLPFGIAFWPPGPNPQFVYVANTGSVVRFPYRNGDLVARGPAQIVVASIPSGGHLRGGGHWTRDIVFSPDGSRMFVSVGSRTNDAENLAPRDQPEIPDGQKAPMGYWDSAVAFAEQHGLAGLKVTEHDRADVLEFKPDGTEARVFASGLRNCVGMAINPLTGALWCSTNERDGLGDNLPPDYITSVREGGFYGWPWFYLGGHEDPHHRGGHPELKDRVIVPDVLLQAHSASLEMTFYNSAQFPPDYRGDAFAAEHGSWNRSRRTGYKVIRVIMNHGKATGEYDDFMTGFVTDDANVWARPVGVAVGHDGSLFVTEDAHGTVWRAAFRDPQSVSPW